MENAGTEILSFELLKIGFSSGGNQKILLPPLNAHAVSGELIAVIGKNGIGKSTLLRTLTGLQPSLGGNIYYSGKSIASYTRMELARRIGYISTEIVKVSNMSVYDLVSLGRFPHTNWIGKMDAPNHKAVMEAIELAGMGKFCTRYIYELSDGERQRAMIARLLAQDTSIMIMDEPTAFLDIGSKYEILNLMHRLSHENGKTIIFSTHDLHMALSQSDKIWLILENQMSEGAPEDLLIKGTFDHLFESSLGKFNARNGTFSFRSESRGNIYIEGEGTLKHWTEKAVNRAGFTVSKGRTTPFITIPRKNNPYWVLKNEDNETQYESLYSLIRFLNK